MLTATVARARALPFGRCLYSTLNTNSILQAVVIDPRLICDRNELQAALEREKKESSTAYTAVRVDLPRPLVEIIRAGKGVQDFGDTAISNPTSGWVFGARGEMTAYRFLGSHTARSGLTSIVPLSAIRELAHLSEHTGASGGGGGSAGAAGTPRGFGTWAGVPSRGFAASPELSGDTSSTPSFEELLKAVDDGKYGDALPGPFLFAGRLTDAVAEGDAGIYLLPKDGETTGLLISNQYDPLY